MANKMDIGHFADIICLLAKYTCRKKHVINSENYLQREEKNIW